MKEQIVSQINSFDPNWLLSTTAQATSALVAIIGGFLISRLISIVSEKSHQIQNLAELRNRHRVKDAELAKFQKTVDKRIQKWFREENLASILEAKGNTNYTKMVNEFKRAGSERQEIAQYANLLKGIVTRAFKDLNEIYKIPAGIPESCVEMRADGIQIESAHDEEIFELVAIQITRERQQNQIESEANLSMNVTESDIPEADSNENVRPSPNFVYERQDAAIKERDRLNEELGVIDGDINFIELHLPVMAQTKRLFQGFIILAYFSIVGIVYPLYLMTRNPVIASASDRTLVLLGFISGLIALLVFIWKSVEDLRAIEKRLAAAQNRE